MMSSVSARSSARYTVALIVGCALFMQTLDSTVIATALPAIAVSMHQDPIRLNLAITSYLLSLAVFIPVSGWAADRFGAPGVFRFAIAIFTIASAICGLSTSLTQLVLARILQGVGGAMMVPVGRLLVLRSVPKSDLVEAMSYLTVPAVLGPVVGPPVGGFIVTYYSWRWIFFINLPIGLLGIALVTLFISNVGEPLKPRFDWRGFALTGLGLAGLVFGFETIGRQIVSAGLTMSIMAAGAICTGLYLVHARRASSPIVDLGLMRIPTFATATASGGLTRMAIGALPFLLAMLLQLVFGLSPFGSGLITFASAVGALTMKFTVGPILRRFGFRSVLVGNGLISAASMMVYATFRPSTSYVFIIAVLLAGGFFRSLQMTALNTLAYADVPLDMMSNASTLASMAQQLFMSLGVSVAALSLHISLQVRDAVHLNSTDFAFAFLVIGAFSFASALLFLPLHPGAGYELSGHVIGAVEPSPEPD